MVLYSIGANRVGRVIKHKLVGARRQHKGFLVIIRRVAGDVFVVFNNHAVGAALGFLSCQNRVVACAQVFYRVIGACHRRVVERDDVVRGNPGKRNALARMVDDITGYHNRAFRNGSTGCLIVHDLSRRDRLIVGLVEIVHRVR